jgi:hypothetical protein
MEDALAAAALVSVVKRRRSHSTTKDREALTNYHDPAHAELPNKGRIGEQEAVFVQDNLELVNQRRVAAGHVPIGAADPIDAKRYGLQPVTPEDD